MKHYIRSAVILCVVLISSMTQAIAENEKDTINSKSVDSSVIADPLESWNRKVFAFNDTLDQYILEPISIGYDAVIPDAVRLLIHNELDYLQSPVSIVNSMLQGDIDLVLHTVGRFFINTTFGGLGLLDASSGFGIRPHQEDFGQTLAVWGVSDGCYYMLPILGPTTLRDLGGRITDFAFSPINYASGDVVYVSSGFTGLGVVDFRSTNRELIDNLKASTSDYYSVVKSIYTQRRNGDIKNATFISEDDQEPEFINFNE